MSYSYISAAANWVGGVWGGRAPSRASQSEQQKAVAHDGLTAHGKNNSTNMPQRQAKLEPRPEEVKVSKEEASGHFGRLPDEVFSKIIKLAVDPESDKSVIQSLASLEAVSKPFAQAVGAFKCEGDGRLSYFASAAKLQATIKNIRDERSDAATRRLNSVFDGLNYLKVDFDTDNVPQELSEAVLRAIEKHPATQGLQLAIPENFQWKDDLVDCLIDKRSVVSELDLGFNKITEQQAKRLIAAQPNMKLVRGLKTSATSELANGLASLHHIKDLSIVLTPNTPASGRTEQQTGQQVARQTEVASSIADLPLHQLCLSLDREKLDSATAAKLAPMLSSLNSFLLVSTFIPKESMEKFSEVLNNASIRGSGLSPLHTLDLRSSFMADLPAEALAEVVKNLPNLKDLNLERTSISADGISKVMPALSNLKSFLSLKLTQGMCEPGLDEAVAKFSKNTPPACEVFINNEKFL